MPANEWVLIAAFGMIFLLFALSIFDRTFRESEK